MCTDIGATSTNKRDHAQSKGNSVDKHQLGPLALRYTTSRLDAAWGSHLGVQPGNLCDSITKPRRHATQRGSASRLLWSYRSSENHWTRSRVCLVSFEYQTGIFSICNNPDGPAGFGSTILDSSSPWADVPLIFAMSDYEWQKLLYHIPTVFFQGLGKTSGGH